MLEINTNRPANDSRGTHPNSLGNLVPGGKLGQRKKLTKAYIDATVDFLMDNRSEFEERMSRLSDRDYVAAYIALGKQIVPKEDTVTHEITPVVDWTINVVPNPSQTAQIVAAQALNKKPRFDVLTDGDSGVEDVTPVPVDAA
jgi:hypothetical protein